MNTQVDVKRVQVDVKRVCTKIDAFKGISECESAHNILCLKVLIMDNENRSTRLTMKKEITQIVKSLEGVYTPVDAAQPAALEED